MSKNEKVMMILERSNSDLKYEKVGDNYILEGVFAEFGKENNNKRIYEEKEYLPHLESLKKSMERATLYGELDHPETFDISLNRVSHIIEKLEYLPKERQVVGRIKLLGTDPGRNAKAILEGGGKLSISSRAAGTVNEDKRVSIKKIFTYDLVAQPGFESAQLNRMNEELGIDFDSECVSIYDGTKFSDYDKFFNEKNESKNIYNKKENIKDMKEDQNNFVTSEELTKYSEHIKKQFEIFESKMSDGSPNIEELKQEFASIKEYMQYLSENIKDTVEVNNGERLDKLVEYLDYLANNMTKVVEHNDYLVENINHVISFADHLAENHNELSDENDKIIKFTDYLSDIHNKSLGFSNYLSEIVQQNVNYSDYLHNKVNESIGYGEYLRNNQNKTINFTNYLSENIQNSIDHNDYIVESINSGVEIKSEPEKIVANNKERIKNINEKIDEILVSVKKQKTETIAEKLNFPYFQLLNEVNKKKFLLLENNQKQKIVDEVNKLKPVNEAQFLAIWENIINPKTQDKLIENLMVQLPENLKSTWEKLDEAKKQRILKQTELFELKTPYQMKDFWQTRLIPHKELEMQKLNESENKDPNNYRNEYMNQIAHSLDKYKAY